MKKQLLLFVTMLMAVIMPMKLWAAEGDAEPYAVLTGDTLLTFFYDDQKVTRNGMDIASSGIPSWFNQRESITKVIFDDSFAGCTTLTSTAYWFYGCKNLKTITNIGYLKTDNVIGMYSMFQDCSSLINLDVSGFNTANVTSMNQMFCNCSSLRSLDVSNFETEKVTDMMRMFYGCSSLENLNLSSFNTSNVTTMLAMFYQCTNLRALNLSSFNTTNVTNMGGLFNGCSNLTNLELSSNFNTVNVTDMNGMFFGCSSLTNLDLSGFKTENVTDMGWMFAGCSGLTSLDVSGFNTSNVTNMSGMFSDCEGLTSLDVSGFNTANVTDMSSMFSTCSSLKNLDLSGFNTSKVIDMRYMFSYCAELKTIYTGSGWSTDKVENGDGMFYNCTSLVGGAGTVYDANHTDHTYAHIDGGTSNPGYFTANNERVINGKFVTTDYSSFAYALEDNGTVIEITDNNIVEDSEEPGNRCIKIVSKDNATENWDSHFIIRIGEPLKEGQTYKFSMRAKASRNVSISSQARTAPDQYLHYRMLGNFDLTTEWQTYNVEGVVESEQAGCTVIALLLNVDKSSAEYFFDDISFRVNEAPSASPEPYAVLSENDTKLTFFYDDQKDIRGGMSVGPFDLNNYPSWYNQRESSTTVEFDDSFANCTTLTRTSFWFYNCGKITSIEPIGSTGNTCAIGKR